MDEPGILRRRGLQVGPAGRCPWGRPPAPRSFEVALTCREAQRRAGGPGGGGTPVGGEGRGGARASERRGRWPQRAGAGGRRPLRSCAGEPAGRELRWRRGLVLPVSSGLNGERPAVTWGRKFRLPAALWASATHFMSGETGALPVSVSSWLTFPPAFANSMTYPK